MSPRVRVEEFTIAPWPGWMLSCPADACVWSVAFNGPAGKPELSLATLRQMCAEHLLSAHPTSVGKRPRTLGEFVEAVTRGDPAAVDAALQWCSARLDAATNDLPAPLDQMRRHAVNSVDRAGNELRKHLGLPDLPVTYPAG